MGTMTDVARQPGYAAGTIANAIAERRLLPAPPGSEAPLSVDDAYLIAADVARRLARPVLGWKLGATSSGGQAALGLAAPLAGRISVVHRETDKLLPADMAPLEIDAEVVFALGKAIEAEMVWDETSIASAIDVVYPALELNRPIYLDPLAWGGSWIIAANAFSAGLVLGAPMTYHDTNGGSRVIGRVESVTVTTPGGEGERRAALVWRTALSATAWLANDRQRRGEPLREGLLVATGALIGPIRLVAGDSIDADFGALGRVRCSISPEAPSAA